MEIWVPLLVGILMFVVGVVVGFFISYRVIVRKIRNNSAIKETIKDMYALVGRNISDADAERSANQIKKKGGLI